LISNKKSPIVRLRNFEALGIDNTDGSTPILQDINLDIFSNEILGIIGPSGAGKTTLLKALGLLTPFQYLKGDYYFENQQVLPPRNGNDLKKIRRNIVFIHQHPVLFKGTVDYNIRYGLKVRNKDEPDFLKRLITSFDLNDLLNKDITLLSGGEKQRVCLLRAMAIEPRILLLDEPTQNLDPANIINIEKNLKQFRGTVVIVTHNLFQAQRIANRVAVLVNGKIIETGETTSLFASPTNTQTVDFLSGKMVF
jgi:ABC-type phosphate transport system ATPase subunit